MTKIKHFMRTFGTPGTDVSSVDDVEAELEYKYLGQGWVILKIDYLGSVRDDKGNEVGYRFMYILTKDVADAKAK